MVQALRMAGDADESGLSFPHLVKWVEMVTRAEAEQVMRDMPLSSAQLFVLVLLRERGEATSAELARMMRITPQALTKLMRPLREDGLMGRRTDADHGRKLPLKLTEKGEALLEEARARSPQVEDNLLADFTPQERATLKHMLARIAKGFR